MTEKIDNLIDQVEKIEKQNAYDLSDVTDDGKQVDEIIQEVDTETFFKEPAAEPEPKKKKGRPNKQTPPPAAKVFGATETDSKTFLDQDQDSQYINLDNEGQTLDATKLTLDNLFPGDTLLVVVDKLMSVVLPLALNSIAGTKLKPSDMKLTADEKKQLKPAIEACAKTIPINLSNPWLALGITAVAVYGAKTVDKINFDNIDASDLTNRVERRGRPRKNN